MSLDFVPGPSVATITQNSSGTWVLSTKEVSIWCCVNLCSKVLQEAMAEASAILCGDVLETDWSVMPDDSLPGPAKWFAYWNKHDKPVGI